jgi:solute carrier family 50 protein (sugar transporter)
MQIPNGCGSFLGAMQLILYAVYRNNKGGVATDGKMQGDDVEMSRDTRINSKQVADGHHDSDAQESTKASKMDSQV